MKPPKTVTVGHLTYRVRVDEATINRARVAAGDDRVGETDQEAQIIAILPGMGVDCEAETVLHEVLHCCVDASGSPLAEGPEEDAVRAISGPLLGALCNNPELVRYLVGDR